ncbi:hypothetical protein JW711_01795 [Candidatus Woesearchaeota archaeon]|nr:hypothetical protein [Candidatus Woesearchaeota archaeon]
MSLEKKVKEAKNKRTEKVSAAVDEEYELLKKEWLPVFKPQYGTGAKIEEIECLKTGIHGSYFGVTVTNKQGKEGKHLVRTLPGSDNPVTIDGVPTKYHQNNLDLWKEYGEIIGDAYD